MRRGFTLVEVMVVLAILGITAAAVVPALERLAPDDEVTRAARQLEAVIVRARNAALERAVIVEVTLVPESARFWVRVDEGPPLDSGTIVLDPAVSIRSPVMRPRVRFDASGTADADSLVVLGSTGARGVVVDRWSGVVHVEPR